MQLERGHLQMGEGQYYYRVDVFITTFIVFDPYVDTEIFEMDNLNKARENALHRADELISILIKQSMFFLPFATPEEFVLGENACYSVTVSIVVQSDGSHIEYPIFGEDEFRTEEALRFEKEVYENLLNN
jgi:hypothetical protein